MKLLICLALLQAIDSCTRWADISGMEVHK